MSEADDLMEELTEALAEIERLQEALDYDVAEAHKGDAWEIVEGLAGMASTFLVFGPAGPCCRCCGERLTGRYPEGHASDCLWLKARKMVDKAAEKDTP